MVDPNPPAMEIDRLDVSRENSHVRTSLRSGFTIAVISRSLAATSYSIGVKSEKFSRFTSVMMIS
jgi:poly(3-hydroxyalkanoate) synthetase